VLIVIALTLNRSSKLIINKITEKRGLRMLTGASGVTVEM
jgi:hypothetical protein